jgi:predicted site-specific integrase-resolvase
MVEMTAVETAEYLSITINNLRQIQHRGNLKWVRREGRKVFYDQVDVFAYNAKRTARKSK